MASHLTRPCRRAAVGRRDTLEEFAPLLRAWLHWSGVSTLTIFDKGHRGTKSPAFIFGEVNAVPPCPTGRYALGRPPWRRQKYQPYGVNSLLHRLHSVALGALPGTAYEAQPPASGECPRMPKPVRERGSRPKTLVCVGFRSLPTRDSGQVSRNASSS
jgi:hypothetical protein